MKYDNVLLKDICCPFCQASEGKSLYTVTASEAATHFILPWQNPEKYNLLEAHLRCLWNQDICQIVICLSCNGVFSLPFVAGDKRFYDLACEQTVYPQEKWEFTRALDWLFQEVEKSKLLDTNVLEIGAGDGGFLRKVIASGIDSKNIAAIEYSDRGRNSLEDLELNCVLFDDIPSTTLLMQWKDKFDFIFMFQVLEHMDDLDTKLTFLRKCLRPQGQIIIAVPNPKKIYFNELNGALLDMPPHHISRFNDSAIHSLAKRNSFEIELVEIEPLDKLKEFRNFCFSRHFRSMQSRNSLAALIAQLPSKFRIRRIGERFYRAITLPVNAMYLPKIEDGESQLAVLQKM